MSAPPSAPPPFQWARLRLPDFGYRGLEELREAVRDAQEQGWPLELKPASINQPLTAELYSDSDDPDGLAAAEAELGLLPPADVLKYLKMKVRAPPVDLATGG